MADTFFDFTTHTSDVPPYPQRVEATWAWHPDITGVGASEDDAAEDWKQKAREAHLLSPDGATYKSTRR